MSAFIYAMATRFTRCTGCERLAGAPLRSVGASSASLLDDAIFAREVLRQFHAARDMGLFARLS